MTTVSAYELSKLISDSDLLKPALRAYVEFITNGDLFDELAMELMDARYPHMDEYLNRPASDIDEIRHCAEYKQVYETLLGWLAKQVTVRYFDGTVSMNSSAEKYHLEQHEQHIREELEKQLH